MGVESLPDFRPRRGRQAPGPRGILLLGKLLDVRRDRLQFVEAMRKTYGNTVRFRMGHRVLHLVSGSAEVRHVLVDNHKNYTKGVGLSEARTWLGSGLVTSEGVEWSRQRQLMQPAFHSERIPEFARTVVRAANLMLEDWKGVGLQRGNLNVVDHLMSMALDVIALSMFRTSISQNAEVRLAFTEALSDAMSRMTQLFPLPLWLPTFNNLRFNRAFKTLSQAIDAIVARHSPVSGADADLLSLMVPACGDRQRGLSADEVRDQIMTVLLAGHETTANSIAWACYALALRPEVWNAVHEEIKEVLGCRDPTPSDLRQLTQTRMVYEESLRLFPPVWLVPRRAIESDRLDEFDIPAGSDVLICPWVIHRHPDYWRDPEEFSPERFNPSNRGSRSPYSYIPFGVGVRACIGTHLAMTEALLVLAMIVQRFRLKLVDASTVAPDPSLTLRFKKGLYMQPIPVA